MDDFNEIITLFPPPAMIKADCGNCKYDALPHEGGHCYMFSEKPGEYCAQFKQKVKK